MSQTFSGSFSTLHRLAFTDHNAISDKVYWTKAEKCLDWIYVGFFEEASC